MTDDPVERGRLRGLRLRKIRRILPEDCRHRFGGGVAPERALARQHFVEHRAKREQVRARVNRVTAHLLRRHVSDGAEHGARVGHGRRVVSSSRSCLQDLRPWQDRSPES